MKVFCMNKISPIGLEKLNSNDEIVKNIDEADTLLVRSADLHDIPIPKNILAIARAGVGVNNIPLSEMAEKGIVVFNTPGANANAVKELVLCGLFLGSREVVDGVNWVNDNANDEALKDIVEKKKSQFAGKEINGKKIGVIGLGGIGVLVANACYSLGMEVYGYDPFLSINNAMQLSRSIRYISDLKDIYKNCDYITMHIPLMKETKNLIDEKAFKLMKNGVVLLNYSREGLIDAQALKDNLANGKIKKYITDFPSYDLMKSNNVIAMPHLGASTAEAEDNCACMAVEQLQKYINEGTIKNSVNYPQVDAGYKISDYRIIINHHNVVGMISEFTKLIAADKGNIVNMINKSMGEYAYTIFDIEGIDLKNIKEDIERISDVLKVRVI